MGRNLHVEGLLNNAPSSGSLHSGHALPSWQLWVNLDTYGTHDTERGGWTALLRLSLSYTRAPLTELHAISIHFHGCSHLIQIFKRNEMVADIPVFLLCDCRLLVHHVGQGISKEAQWPLFQQNLSIDVKEYIVYCWSQMLVCGHGAWESFWVLIH